MRRIRKHLTGGIWPLCFGLISPLWADEVPPVQARAYHPPPPSVTIEANPARPFCPEKAPPPFWREAQVIDGVELQEELVCLPDNPYFVAAVVRGTNNISLPTLRNTQLAPDAVIKGSDLDGDGDPDEITIKLEIAELNGASPDALNPVYRYEIAPGITPGIITFVPKGRGPATKSPESSKVNALFRLPAPVIRVEQGDRVEIVLENSHYLPHTFHLQGVDHPFFSPQGEGNDGTPLFSETPLLPGQRKSYQFTPRRVGTFLYLDLASAPAASLGLVGMLIVEENRPGNLVQTLNLGGGKVRHPAAAVVEAFDQEYDLILGGINKRLSDLLQSSNDPRVIALRLNQQSATAGEPDHLLLNGRSFPYTLRESLIVAEVNQDIRLHVLNARNRLASLRFHGHRLVQEASLRDVVALAPWQRLDLKLITTNDGQHASGPGLWVFGSVPTAPGSDLSVVAYKAFLNERGFPKWSGDLAPYFTEAFQKGRLPLWQDLFADKRLGVPQGLDAQLTSQPEEKKEKPPVVSSPWLNFVVGLFLGLFAYVLFSNRDQAVKLVRRFLQKEA